MSLCPNLIADHCHFLRDPPLQIPGRARCPHDHADLGNVRGILHHPDWSLCQWVFQQKLPKIPSIKLTPLSHLPRLPDQCPTEQEHRHILQSGRMRPVHRLRCAGHPGVGQRLQNGDPEVRHGQGIAGHYQRNPLPVRRLLHLPQLSSVSRVKLV